MGHSVKGHNGILLPSMLIFTAWADLLFFLISVNFRICLSSRLTPFLEVPWNLKNKTNNYHWKKADSPEVQGKQRMQGSTWARSWGNHWAQLVCLFSSQNGKMLPLSICRAQVEAVALTAITVRGQWLCSWILFGNFCIYWLELPQNNSAPVSPLWASCKGVRHRYTVTKADTSIPRCHFFKRSGISI